jgi:hypothetical protein
VLVAELKLALGLTDQSFNQASQNISVRQTTRLQQDNKTSAPYSQAYAWDFNFTAKKQNPPIWKKQSNEQWSPTQSPPPNNQSKQWDHNSTIQQQIPQPWKRQNVSWNPRQSSPPNSEPKQWGSKQWQYSMNPTPAFPPAEQSNQWGFINKNLSQSTPPNGQALPPGGQSNQWGFISNNSDQSPSPNDPYNQWEYGNTCTNYNQSLPNYPQSNLDHHQYKHWSPNTQVLPPCTY